MEIVFVLFYIALTMAIIFSINEYYSKKSIKNKKLFRYGIAVFLLIFYIVVLFFLNKNNMQYIIKALSTIIFITILTFFTLTTKYK